MAAIGDLINCGICGKEFVKSAPNKRYCSPACAAAAMFSKRENNKPHAKEVRQKWVEKNKEKIRKQHKEYYQRHKAKIKEQNRTYRLRKKEKEAVKQE